MLYSGLEDYVEWEQARMQKIRASNIPFDASLRIEQLLVSDSEQWADDYSRTEQVLELPVDEYGILNTRHREESWFRAVKREAWKDWIYAKGSKIRQERHLLAGTNEMMRRISERISADGDLLDAEDLGLNMILERDDGRYVLLEWLPIGTNFMVYPEDTEDISDKKKLVANLRLVTQQNWCWITWKSIANRYGDKDLFGRFKEESKYDRGSVLVVDWPVWQHLLQINQRVFIGLPTWRIR